MVSLAFLGEAGRVMSAAGKGHGSERSTVRKTIIMSIDRSLKVAANLSGKRSVLTRAERIEKLKMDKKWDDKKHTALNIPKTLVGKA